MISPPSAWKAATGRGVLSILFLLMASTPLVTAQRNVSIPCLCQIVEPSYRKDVSFL